MALMMDFETRQARKAQALEDLQRTQRNLDRIAENLCPVEGLGAVWEETVSARAKVQNLWHQLDRTELKRNVSDWVGVEVPCQFRDFEVAYAVINEDHAATVRVFPNGPNDSEDDPGMAYSIDPDEPVAEQLLQIGRQAYSHLGLSDPEHPIRFEAEI